MTGFTPEPHDTLRQGDIILAPAAILLPGSAAPALAPAPVEVGGHVSGALWDGTGNGNIPAVDVDATYIPVMVLSHDCELEKEFNERVAELLAQGMGKEEAVEVASADPALDPFAAVAPVLPLRDFDPRRHQGIRNGQRIGVFPVPSLPHENESFAVDLFRACTVSTELLRSAPKLASLDEESVYVLRFKLSEAYASRDLSTLEELNRAIGARVTNVEAVGKNRKTTSLILHLEDREALHLDIRKPRDALAPEVTRTPHAPPSSPPGGSSAS